MTTAADHRRAARAARHTRGHTLLSELRPGLADELVDQTLRGHLTAGSRDEVGWTCPRCGYLWLASPAARVAGRSCPACLGRGLRSAADPVFSSPRPDTSAVLRDRLIDRLGAADTTSHGPGVWARWGDVGVRILESTEHHAGRGFTADVIADAPPGTLTVWRDNLHARFDQWVAAITSARGTEPWDPVAVVGNDPEWAAAHATGPIPPTSDTVLARDVTGRLRAVARLGRYRGQTHTLHRPITDGAAMGAGEYEALVDAAAEWVRAAGGSALTLVLPHGVEWPGTKVRPRQTAWRLAGGPGQRLPVRGALSALPPTTVYGFEAPERRVRIEL